MKKLVILGSTGSIGVSALEVIKGREDEFELFAITAFSRVGQLKEQINAFQPRYAHLPTDSFNEQGNALGRTKLISGESALTDIITNPEVDMVLVAIVGIAALNPVYQALKAGKTVLLANKEALICAGELLTSVEKQSGGRIIPVDSEHSALYQLLNGRLVSNDIATLTLTASGGPFLHTPLNELKEITPAQAVKHPRWSMGAKISIDSATMVNKALEVAEARWLFDLEPERIKIVVHPESIIHGLVNFKDGVSFAQASLPDMKAPISYALKGDFSRFEEVLPPLDLPALQKLTFYTLDQEKFPAPGLMYQALEKGEALPAVYNCANETAVELFMKGDIGFLQIVSVIEKALEGFDSAKYATIEDLVDLHKNVKSFVLKL